MFLNSVRSKLLMPGPRTTSFGELPASPRAGRPNAVVLNHCSNPCWLEGRLGSPTSVGTPLATGGADAPGPPAQRDTSPPPVMSALSVVVKETFTGDPL